MATKFSELDPADPLVGTEIVAVSQLDGGVLKSKKATVADIAGLAGGGSAEEVSYDNSTSGLTATDVQDAIDELAASRAKNHSDTRDPVATDDSSAGYSGVSDDSPGSRWFNSSTGEVFACMDATAGAAVWVKTSLTLDELGSAALANVGTGAAEVPTNGDLGTAAYTSRAGMPFANILADGGRFGALSGTFPQRIAGPFGVNTSFFGAYNGSSLSEAGKFIYNNTDFGGSDGYMTATTVDLLGSMGRAGEFARYGVEFYIASLDFGGGTGSPKNFPGGTLYLGSVNATSAIFAANNIATFCGWVRAIGGAVGLGGLGSSFYSVDGVLATGYYELDPSEGWVFVRLAVPRPGGYMTGFPLLYGASGRSLQIACPAVFTGDVDTGMHTSPIPNVGVL